MFEDTGNQGYVHKIKELTQSWHARDKKEVQQLEDLEETHCSKIKSLSPSRPVYPTAESDPLTVVTKPVIIDHELNRLSLHVEGIYSNVNNI